MADISKITLPSGSTYNIKDTTARTEIDSIKSSITGGMHFLGTTTTALSDGDTTNPVSIAGASVTAKSGDIVIYGTIELVYSDADNKWHEFGSTGSLKALAFKASATGKFTPSGTVSKPTFSGSQGTVTVSGTPNGRISEGTGTANYTPKGSVSAPTITVTPTTSTTYVASSAKSGGSVTNGTAAACTLPELSMSVSNETLSLSWSAGSFTPNTPTSVTLPSFSSKTVATGITSASASQPTFTGTGAELVFTGSNSSATGNFTPSGSVSQPTFTGTEGNVTVS